MRCGHNEQKIKEPGEDGDAVVGGPPGWYWLGREDRLEQRFREAGVPFLWDGGSGEL